MHPITAIELHRREIERTRRDALAARGEPRDDETPDVRRRRFRLPRLVRRRTRTA